MPKDRGGPDQGIFQDGESAPRRDGAQDETIKFSSRCVARHSFITTQ
jgi:hypothetical protein